MAKDGFKIFDSDTHVGPFVDVLDPYLSAEAKEKLAEWEEFKTAHHKTGHVTYIKGQRRYRRRLGTAAAEDTPARYMAGFTGPKRSRNPDPEGDTDPALRIADMDIEGVDVNLTLPSGWFGTWTTGDDVALEQAMYQAYHRWMDAYCSPYPDRLGGVILCCARDVPGAVAEIEKWGKSKWAWGILVYAPYGSPLDHPDLEPIWKAAADHDLSITLHTFTVMPPYAPGGLDNWENLWLQRSAAHPWCGMRNMAALIGSGVMDRYPEIRIGTLEAGHGWLPFWMARIDEHYDTIRAALPPDLKQKPSEYVLSGRYFQSIEIPEGQAITQSVIDMVGDGVLMYASDYPHSESHFPESVDLFMKWDLPDDLKRKMLWDNAVKFYARAELQ
ncbi:MAG: amidohydrolase family protein [Alphaproteobacteria bacterium]|nr:amidohydrolase family protein [Alphaproteobacteria bacterium]